MSRYDDAVTAAAEAVVDFAKQCPGVHTRRADPTVGADPRTRLARHRTLFRGRSESAHKYAPAIACRVMPTVVACRVMPTVERQRARTGRGGLYAFMGRAVASERGGEAHGQRRAIIDRDLPAN